MKILSFLSIAIFGLMLSISACGGESATKTQARESLKTTTPVPPPPGVTQPAAPAPNAAQPIKPAEPPQNSKGVWHFTCAKGCAGGGGAAAEKCGGCGGPLTHNATYHQ